MPHTVRCDKVPGHQSTHGPGTAGDQHRPLTHVRARVRNGGTVPHQPGSEQLTVPHGQLRLIVYDQT
ncbi:hypothetical protein, partial [Streptomyces sp. WELS2]|uniref:hypothetical protein n=1 Tax=Streptomyces sp. WELS2 TaxID=2749435 RepID=UPI0037DDA967